MGLGLSLTAKDCDEHGSGHCVLGGKFSLGFAIEITFAYHIVNGVFCPMARDILKGTHFHDAYRGGNGLLGPGGDDVSSGLGKAEAYPPLGVGDEAGIRELIRARQMEAPGRGSFDRLDSAS